MRVHKWLLAALLLSPAPVLGQTYSVTSYGATSGLTTDATAGFERAIAAAADSIRRAPPGEPNPVRLVKVPAGAYLTTRTIWLPDGVDLVGDGFASQLVLKGSTRHPAVAVGVDDPQVKPAERPDLFGVLDASAAPRPGVRRGVDTSTGLYLSIPHGDMATGRWDGGAFDYWQKTDVLTLDVAIVRDPSKPWGRSKPLLGNGKAGALNRPRPWTLSTGSTRDGYLEFAYSTDLSPGEHQGADNVVSFAVPDERTLRISVLADLKNARFAAWVNGVRVSASWRDASPGRHFRHNTDWPLVVGRQGFGDDAATLPFVLAGLRLDSGERYETGEVGSPQKRIDGGPLNDLYRYFALNEATEIGHLSLDEPVAARALSAWGWQSIPHAAYLLRSGQGGATPNRIADLSIHSGGPGVVVGAVMSLDVQRVRILSGAGPAVGSLPLIISYPVNLTDCQLASGDAPVQAWTWLSSIDRAVLIGGRDAVRARGGAVDVLRVLVSQPTRHVADAAFTFLPGDYGDNTFRVERAIVNAEDSAFFTAVVACHQPDGDYQPVSLVVRDLMAGNTGPLFGEYRPLVKLLAWPGSTAPAQASVERARSNGCTVVVEAGGGWQVEQRQNTQAKARPPVSDGPGR